MNKYATWLMAGLFITMAGRSQSTDESVPLSFETLFLPSWYERAYTTSMQLLVFHEKIQEMRDLLPERASEIIDSCLAKLVYLQYCVNNMITNELTIPSENLEYLANLITQVKQTINDSILSLCADDRVEVIKQLLHSITENVTQFVSIHS